MRRDPYADLGEVYAEETSNAKIGQQPTAKTPNLDQIDENLPGWRQGSYSAKTTGMPLHGFHIDGDPRYQEK